MEKSPSIFIKIDEFIFHKLDYLKTEGVFQKFNDMLSSMEEAQQKLIAQLTTFFFILIPFIFTLFLWWGNYQTKKAIEVKKQIIEQIAIFEGNQTTLNNISSNYLAPSAILGREDLDNKIRNLLSQNSIDQSKVNIQNFNQTSTSSTVAKIEAQISFQNFGTNDFSTFMRSLVENERFKIIKIDLTKNKETSLLNGSVSVRHMGQNTFSNRSE